MLALAISLPLSLSLFLILFFPVVQERLHRRGEDRVYLDKLQTQNDLPTTSASGFLVQQPVSPGSLCRTCEPLVFFPRFISRCLGNRALNKPVPRQIALRRITRVLRSSLPLEEPPIALSPSVSPNGSRDACAWIRVGKNERRKRRSTIRDNNFFR